MFENKKAFFTLLESSFVGKAFTFKPEIKIQST